MKNKRILVIGYGAVGGPIIEEAGEAGIQNITVAGRSALEDLPEMTVRMFSSFNVKYIGGVDLYDEDSTNSLRETMEDSDIVFHTAAGYPVKKSQVSSDVGAFENVLSCAKVAGYTPGSGKRLAFAGSPPTRVRLKKHPKPGKWQEDYLVKSRKKLGDCGKTPYFKAKIKMAHLADSLADEVAWVEFAPTMVVSAWADHGRKVEVLPLYWKNKMTIAPDRKVDSVAGQDMAKAALKIATKGTPGEVYQISGAPFSIATMIRKGLKYAGEKKLPQKHSLSDFELEQLICHGKALKPFVDLARLPFLICSAGLIDPIGEFSEEVFDPSYAALIYTMGKKRDMSKAISIGATQGSYDNIINDLKRQMRFLASKGRLPGSCL